MIVDKLGRKFRNLRVSLTAACNYACTYCVPEGEQLRKARYELDAVQLLKCINLIQDVTGVSKLRITGGEPLIASGFDEFLSCLQVEAFEDVSITTNGQILTRKLPLILDANIKRLNISLDTLDKDKFKLMARAGSLKSVLRGIEDSLLAGLKIKINMVPIRGENDDQILPLLDYCLDRGIELRFIELMKMGHLSQSGNFDQIRVSLGDILETISDKYEIEKADSEFDATAIRYEVKGRGFFGVIANDSVPFCQTCSRLRLSSSGYLHGCLSNTKRHSMRDLLDLPNAVALKSLQSRLTDVLSDKQERAFSGGATVMKFIGG